MVHNAETKAGSKKEQFHWGQLVGTVCDWVLQQAEARAEFAERSVTKLQKEVDRLEGKKCLVETSKPFLLDQVYLPTNRNFLPHALTEKLVE